MSTTDPTKRCPLCGEEILAVALRCKHCQADLTSGTPTATGGAAPTQHGEGLATAYLLLPFGASILMWFWVGSMNLLQDPQSSLNLIAILTIVVTGTLAAVEASRLGIGGENDRDARGRKRSGPAHWLVFHLLLWVIAFPSYLYWRSKYGAKNMVVGGIVVALLFTGTTFGMTATIDSQKAEIRERLEQVW